MQVSFRIMLICSPAHYHYAVAAPIKSEYTTPFYYSYSIKLTSVYCMLQSIMGVLLGGKSWIHGNNPYICLQCILLVQTIYK